jgi:hypothetical protein
LAPGLDHKTAAFNGSNLTPQSLYALDHWGLTCHTGIVSAIYPTRVATMMQLDASVDQATWEERGDVLVIITRRATRLTHAFDDLLKSFDEAISVLSESKFFITTTRAMISIQ